MTGLTSLVCAPPPWKSHPQRTWVFREPIFVLCLCILKRIPLYLLRAYLELLSRQVIKMFSVSPSILMLLPKDISVAAAQCTPVFLVPQSALSSTELGALHYRFAFLTPTNFLWQISRAENPTKTHWLQWNVPTHVVKGHSTVWHPVTHTPDQLSQKHVPHD